MSQETEPSIEIEIISEIKPSDTPKKKTKKITMPDKYQKRRAVEWRFIDGINHKKCTECFEWKLPDGYYSNGRGSLSARCRKCKNLNRMIWRNKSPENKEKDILANKKYYSKDEVILHRKNYMKNWALTNPERKKDCELRSKYGINLDQYIQMRESQNYRCKICNTHETDIAEKELVVDHCHNTGIMRGLLCGLCNKALGQFKDNLTSMFNAYKYIRNSRKIPVPISISETGSDIES